MRFCGVRFWWAWGGTSELLLAFVSHRAWHVYSQSTMGDLDINAYMDCYHLLSHRAALCHDPGWLLLVGEGKVAEGGASRIPPS